MAGKGIHVQPKPGEAICLLDSASLEEIIDCMEFAYENDPEMTEKDKGFNRHVARRLESRLKKADELASRLEAQPVVE